MKQQIRHGVFETNSSSTHSLTICSSEDYEKWIKGELYYEVYENRFIDLDTYEKIVEKEKEDMIESDIDIDNRFEIEEFIREGHDIVSYDRYLETYLEDYESFKEKYKTKNGDEVVVFGYYGYC